MAVVFTSSTFLPFLPPPCRFCMPPTHLRRSTLRYRGASPHKKKSQGRLKATMGKCGCIEKSKLALSVAPGPALCATCSAVRFRGAASAAAPPPAPAQSRTGAAGGCAPSRSWRAQRAWKLRELRGRGLEVLVGHLQEVGDPQARGLGALQEAGVRGGLGELHAAQELKALPEGLRRAVELEPPRGHLAVQGKAPGACARWPCTASGT